MPIEADGNARFQKAQALEILSAIEGCRLRYQNTNNPLFALKALDQWFMLNRTRVASGDEAVGMPEWIAAYLAVVARRITNLTDRLDYRVAPEPYGTLPRTQEALRTTRDRPQSLTTRCALRLLPRALGLARSGWNAFERAWSLSKMEADELSVDLFRFVGGKSEGDTFEMVLTEHRELADKVGGGPAVTDARSLRRRISKARKARIDLKPGG